MADEKKKADKKKAEPRKDSFWKGLKAEWKKIVWTDRNTLGKQTVAVVSISAIVCLMITLVDSLGLQIMQLIIR